MTKTILVLALMLCPLVAGARVGNDQGNGGDMYAAEFVNIAWKVANFLRNSQITEVNVDKFEQTVRRTKVESTTRPLSLNHLPKDAINYPRQSRIVFNRGRWKAMDNGERPVLVLHEYLGLMGVEGASYDYSRRLLGAFRYGQWHQVNCSFSGGNLNAGIDESYGGDTILLSANFDDGHWFMGLGGWL